MTLHGGISEGKLFLFFFEHELKPVPKSSQFALDIDSYQSRATRNCTSMECELQNH